MPAKILRVATAVAVAIVVLTITPARASGSAQGHLLTTQGALPFGVTGAEFALVQDCSAIPDTQGIDGYVIDAGSVDKVTLTASAPAPFSVSVGFFGENCQGLGGGGGYTGGLDPLVVSPTANARWIFVYGSFGANIDFDLSWIG